jgi:hypothetical protein
VTALSDTSQQVQFDDRNEEGSTQKHFGDGMASLEFTFHSAIAVSTATDGPSIGSNPRTVEWIQGLKHPKGHPDGPSAPNSPEKKYTRSDAAPTRNSPPILAFSSVNLLAKIADVTTTSDTFGGSSRIASKSNKKLTNAKLDSFFQTKTPEAKLERRTRYFEHIANERESQDFLDAHAQTLQRAHSVKYTDLVCENKSDKSPKVSIPRIFGGLYKPTEGVRWAHCRLNIKLPKHVRLYYL